MSYRTNNPSNQDPINNTINNTDLINQSQYPINLNLGQVPLNYDSSCLNKYVNYQCRQSRLPNPSTVISTNLISHVKTGDDVLTRKFGMSNRINIPAIDCLYTKDSNYTAEGGYAYFYQNQLNECSACYTPQCDKDRLGT